MLQRSFRLRIALLSAILAGSALVGFGLISWWLIYQAKLSRLDVELEIQLMRAGRPRPPERWQSEPILNKFGTNSQLLILGTDGKILYRSPGWAQDLIVTNWTHQPILPPQPEQPPPKPKFITQHTATDTWRVAAMTTPFSRIAIAVSLKAIAQEMAIIRNIFLISIPGVLILVAGGAWAIAGSSLHSIRRLTKVIGKVTATGLEQRVPIAATDLEFVELIQVFNQMLSRLEHSFKQASRFSADAAHELKTPLAILQGELEQTLQQAETGSQMQESLSDLLSEVRRLSGIVRKLLLLSLADAGQISLYRVEVNVSDLLKEMLEDIELLAPNLEIQTAIAEDLLVKGDRDLLVQVLQNLISNAIKYNLPNGWIRIEACCQEALVFIKIINCSQEIPASDRDRLFDRFYRGDPARTRQVEGIGLGLSLAREIARAHHGNLILDPTIPRQTGFTLTLPK